jgi:hypothetical protein
MFTKTAIALVLLVGAVSTAAAQRANPAHNVYDTGGRLIGSDPDPHVRSMLSRDLER